MKTKVYIDLDGTLADYAGFFIDHLKVSSDKEVTAEQKIYYHDNEDLFIKLKPFPANGILLEAVKQLFGSFFILTTPMQHNRKKCEEDKLLWVMKHLDIKPRDIIFADDKSHYANCNILIDDFRPNIERWNAAGGIGIKYKARSTNYTVHDVIDKLNRVHWEINNYGVI